MPDLTESIDLTTDSIEGGTESLRAQTEAWQKNAEAQAYQEAYQNLMGEYNEVLVEAAENFLRLTEAQNKLRAMEERTDIIRQMQEMEADPSLYDGGKYYQLEQRILALNHEMMDGYKVVDAYQEAVDKSSAAVEEAKAAAFAKVQEGKEAFAGTVRDLQVDVDQSMSETVQTVDQAVESMNLHEKAYASMQSTFQGLIDGANEMAGPLRAALGSAGMGILSAGSVGLSVPGATPPAPPTPSLASLWWARTAPNWCFSRAGSRWSTPPRPPPCRGSRRLPLPHPAVTAGSQW